MSWKERELSSLSLLSMGSIQSLPKPATGFPTIIPQAGFGSHPTQRPHSATWWIRDMFLQRGRKSVAQFLQCSAVTQEQFWSMTGQREAACAGRANAALQLHGNMPLHNHRGTAVRVSKNWSVISNASSKVHEYWSYGCNSTHKTKLADCWGWTLKTSYTNCAFKRQAKCTFAEDGNQVA